MVHDLASGRPDCPHGAHPRSRRHHRCGHALAAYEAIHPLIRAAWAALRAVGFPEPSHVGARIEDATVLTRAAALGRALELRDDRGALVSTDCFELTEQLTPDTPSPIVWVRSRQAPATVPAASPRPDSAGFLVA